jgi:hypothetical protein
VGRFRECEKAEFPEATLPQLYGGNSLDHAKLTRSSAEYNAYKLPELSCELTGLTAI